MSNLEDSIFLIKSAKKENVIGTGFIFHKQQNYTYLLTCAHIIKDVGGEENIRVNDLPAEVIKIGDVQGLDLAILKINTTFSASSLKLKKSRALVHLMMQLKCYSSNFSRTSKPRNSYTRRNKQCSVKY